MDAESPALDEQPRAVSVETNNRFYKRLISVAGGRAVAVTAKG